MPPSKRVIHKRETYTKWKSETSAYHSFSNRRTVNFQPADKSAITRKRTQLQPHIKAVEEGRATFVPATKEKLNAVKRTGQYITTNKGFFVYGTAIEKVKVKVEKVGRRKVAAIQIGKPQKREVYYSVKPSFDNVNDLIEWIFTTVKPRPSTVRVAINQYSSSWAKGRKAWNLYAETMATIEEEIKDEGYETPFRGVFAVWNL